MNNNFEEDWKEFIKGNFSERPPERLCRYKVAKIFYELGFSAAVSK